MLRPTVRTFWSVNILMLYNVNLMFRYDTGTVGIAHHSKSIQSTGVLILLLKSVNQPLQIILNSVVIVLMCLFVAMMLIEVIKHLTGIEYASSETFENFMMKRAEE
jgi:hypothetical protein